MNLFKRKPKEETVSKAEHERIVGDMHKQAVTVTTPLKPLAKVVHRMDADYGYPAGVIASDLEMEKADVLTILRFLQVSGLAKRHPFFDEDSSAIRGSGYSLTVSGLDFKEAISPQSRDKQQAEVGA